MKKRVLTLLTMALIVLMALTGCSKGPKLQTDLGSFTVIHASLMDTYHTMNAKSGEKLLVVRMEADDDFDETRFKSYFSAEDGSSSAKVQLDGVEYACVAVAYQGKASDKDVEYVLVFQVPSSTAATSFQLQAPSQAAITVEIAQ